MDIVVPNGILKQDFYANVRTSSGDYYSKSSLVAGNFLAMRHVNCYVLKSLNLLCTSPSVTVLL